MGQSLLARRIDIKEKFSSTPFLYKIDILVIHQSNDMRSNSLI